MSNYRRLITMNELREIAPYFKYFSATYRSEKEFYDFLYPLVISGCLYRSAIVGTMNHKFRAENPNKPVPKCLKTSAKITENTKFHADIDAIFSDDECEDQ